MVLGIMGGMGPAATVDLFSKITEFSHATVDQNHIHVVIDSNTNIPDRSKYILGTGEDPTFEMIKSLVRLEMMGADRIVIPCNTAHYFYDKIVPYTKVPVMHMIEVTAEFLIEAYPNTKEYMLFATEGTYASGVYKKIFQKYNLSILEPNEPDRKAIMTWIYKVKAGNFSIDLSEVEALIDRYKNKGEIPFILGCTELPLLAEKLKLPTGYIDPVAILARRCVQIAEEDSLAQS